MLRTPGPGLSVPRGKSYDQGIWSRHQVCGLRQRGSEARDVRVFSPFDTAPIVSAVLWSCRPRRSQALETSQYGCKVCGATTLPEDFGQVRHTHAGRKGGVRLATRQALQAPLFSATDCSVVLGSLSNTYPYIPMSLLLVMGWTDKSESRTNNYNCRPQDVIDDPRALPVHLSLTPGTPRNF
jgi:hypothetical protein